jgi:hypothetical protein
MKVLGLDISTSITGICVLESNNRVDEPTIHIIDRIEFKSGDSIWKKADMARNFFETDAAFLAATSGLDAVFVEESLQSFRTGFSSAATITTLAKFNSLLSYFVRQKFSTDPVYLAATSARKTCGIKVMKTSVCGKNAKDQTFEWAMAGPLQHINWPKKKSGEPKDWARDAVDSYVIARAGLYSRLK